MLFPFMDFWWFYAGFTVFVLLMLALDLGIFNKKPHEISFKESTVWTVIWISLALVFNFGLYMYSNWKFGDVTVAKQIGLEFLTGFVVEKALAVDNIFVFAMVFSYFHIPKIYQHRVLMYGILGALVFRAIFIALGSYLLAIHWVLVLFGAFLILTGLKMMFAKNEAIDFEGKWIIRMVRKLFRVWPKCEGPNFFVRRDGLLYVTPLFLALLFIEMSDIVFALDSVPAIFAITKEPLIVFSSNMFAILGLRSVYFMLIGVIDKFAYIKYGLASILVFVGLKMVWLNDWFDGKFPISWSLGIIAALLGSSIAFSLWMDARKKLVGPVTLPNQ